MDQPNTPLPSASLTSFYNGSTAYPIYPTPQQIVNPTPIPQTQLRFPHRLEGRERQPSLQQYQSIRSACPRQSILATSEARGINSCRASSSSRSLLSGIAQPLATTKPSTSSSRPARSYIRSWRRQVGEAASGHAADSNDEGSEGPAPVAPILRQRDSGLSTQDSSVTETGEEHTRDVQQDVPLNTFSRAVHKAAREDGGNDAVRQETIKQERLVEENQTKQQSQEQKKALAEKMVDIVHDLICSTWPSACEFDSPRSGSDSESETSAGEGLADGVQNGLVPLRAFIREILRRSKSSCATLRCAEWYLLRVRQILSVASEESSSASSSGSESSEPDLKRLPASSPLLCPRRAFLSALIVAHKFLHDRVYSNRAWAKVSGLDVTEIGKGELALACLLDWKLWVGREEHDPESGIPSQQDETTWFTAVGQQVPIPCKRSLPEEPSSTETSSAEVATQCSSTDSSPSHLAGSVASTMETGPRLGVPQAGSTFSSTAGSFAFVSPAHWQSNGRDMGRHHSVENSAMTTLSTSMPGLSLGSMDGSSDTSVSPANTPTEKDGEIHVRVNGEEQFSVQITSSPESFVDQPRVRWNPRKRGSPQEEEGHDLGINAFSQDGLKSIQGIQTGKKRRVSISKSQPTRICNVN